MGGTNNSDGPHFTVFTQSASSSSLSVSTLNRFKSPQDKSRKWLEPGSIKMKVVKSDEQRRMIEARSDREQPQLSRAEQPESSRWPRHKMSKKCLSNIIEKVSLGVNPLGLV